MELKMTPLNQVHKDHGAKMVDFGGWHMPVQYEGIIEEHNAVRTKAGLFDVSHMGSLRVKGPDALNYLQKMVSNDLSKIKVGQIQYVILCYENGGAVDDLLVYKITEDEYLLVVNASNKDKDFEWLMKHKEGNVEIVDESDITSIIAIQGPKALDILQKITDVDLDKIKFYWWENGKVNNVDTLISRTGYTGEDGFEVYVSPEYVVDIWKKIIEVGNGEVVPAGLGARDTLRFEAGLPLYGQEIGEDITPLEAGLGFFVALDKEFFIGQEVLKKQKKEGIARKIVGFEMIDRGIARSEYDVYVGDEKVGFVTTGSLAPTLNKNIGNALIKKEHANIDQELLIDIRGKKKKAKIIARPFYRR